MDYFCLVLPFNYLKTTLPLHIRIKECRGKERSCISIKKIGYLAKKKAGGKIYIYLRVSFREKGVGKHRNIYSFGSMPDALEKMYWFRDNPEQFPQSLIDLHYDLLDLQEWILTIETGVTSKGRMFTL